MYFRVVNSVSRKNDPWIKMRLTVRRKDTSSCSEPPSLASSAILGYAAASDLFNPSEHPILSFFCYPHSHAVLLQLSSHVLVHSRVCMLRRGGGGGGGAFARRLVQSTRVDPCISTGALTPRVANDALPLAGAKRVTSPVSRKRRAIRTQIFLETLETNLSCC